ncbi:MAG: uncharacterized protein QOH70_2112 [Blastocatellia bacterium]|jgi:uncharacterized Fe-S cluster-containing radical SAM superfamily protein|nr:uncharacterized protein [Blastocatellia bacterium]
MAAVSGPTQESKGPLFPVADSLPAWLSNDRRSTFARASGESEALRYLGGEPISASVKQRKREVNAFLPIIAASYAHGTLGREDLATFFRYYAHLYTVGIDTNAICNLSCGYCYLDAYNPTTAPQYADLKYFRKALSQITEKGVDLVALVGKEPFADDRGIELLRFLDELSLSGADFRYGVVTNGTLIDRYIERLPRSLAYIDISLDGPEEINDNVRGVGVFKRAGRNMRALVERGYEVWTSSVLHTNSCNRRMLSDFMKTMICEFGCSRFYFSPVRNFTGSLHPFLLSFEEIARVEDSLAELAELIPGVETLILDHPYEAVWRDYFWPLRLGQNTRFQELVIDEHGNVLQQISSRCFQKLDIFPHGPWGTCRMDARGTYLSDVESRTYSNPEGVGSILEHSPHSLMATALQNELASMLDRFLANMHTASILRPATAALTSVSSPPLGNSESPVAFYG